MKTYSRKTQPNSRAHAPLALALALALILAVLSTPANAKHLESERVGIGVALHDFQNTGAVSLRYIFDNYFSMTLMVGFDTATAKNVTLLGGKVLRNMHLEENMNFFVGAALYFLSGKQGTAVTSQGAELDGLMGVEFFFAGLPNLGFQFETGVAVRTIGGTTFKTLGDGFLGLGIHYYF